MFCTRCGAQNADGQCFCSNCGAPLTNGAPVEKSESAAENAYPSPGFVSYQEPPLADSKPARGRKSVVKPEKPRKKKGAIGWILGGIALVLVAAALFCVFNWSSVSTKAVNFAVNTFSSPEKYYRDVELKAADRWAETVSKQYAEAAKNTAEDRFYEEELTVSLYQDALSDELLEMLEDEIGFDIDWIKSVGLYVSGGVDEDVIGGDLIAYLNGEDIIGASAAFDAETEDLYVSVKDLSNDYFKVPLEDELSGYGDLNAEAVLELQKLLQNEDKVKDAVERYMAIITDNATTVEMGTEEVTAGEVSTLYNVIEVRFDKKALIRIAKQTLDELHDDRFVEDLVCTYLQAGGMSDDEVDDAFNDFLDNIEDERERLDDMDPDDFDGEIVMLLYVNGSGEVFGRNVKIRDEGELRVEASYLLTLDGTNFGLDARIHTIDNYVSSYSNYYWKDDYDFKVSGSGTVSLKKTLNGTFDARLKYENDYNGNVSGENLKLFKITVDAALEKDSLSFDIQLVPAKDLLNYVVDNSYMPEAVEDAFRSLTLGVSGSIGKNRFETQTAVRCNKKDALVIALTGQEILPYEVNIPSSSVDVYTWAQGVDLNKLFTIGGRLRDAGMPASLLEQIGLLN